MADQLSFGGVIEPALPIELDSLAKVMGKDREQNDVAIERWIEHQHAIGEFHHLLGVLEKSANPRVMHTHRGGRAAKILHEPFVAEVLLSKRAHRRMRH